MFVNACVCVCVCVVLNQAVCVALISAVTRIGPVVIHLKVPTHHLQLVFLRCITKLDDQ